MDITLQYFNDCPHWKTTHERLQSLAAERDDVSVTLQRIETPEEAERLQFHGSPSILVDGVDVFAGVSAPVGLTCRRDHTEDGVPGAPTLEQIRAALPAS